MSALRALRPALRSVRAAQVARVAVAARPVAMRAFHVSFPARGSGESDAELAAALASEHAYETEAASEEKPAFLKELLNEGVWSLADEPANDDVVLSRKFGDETIKLTFQVSDLDESEPMEGVDPNGEAVDGVSPPCITTTCLMSKSSSPKALLVDLGAHPDGFEVTNVALYDKALAEKTGADADWTRRSLYMGPHYDTLDTSVQDAFAGYLAERGVDEALSNFIVQYCEHKEQKDYISWLAGVKDFVKA